MKTTIAITIAVTTLALAGCCPMPEAKTLKDTYSSFDLPSEHPAKDGVTRLSYEAQELPVAGDLKM